KHSDSQEPYHRYAESGLHGTFRLSGVPAGDYTISAATAYHSTKDVTIHVDEGRTTPVTLSLARTDPDLKMEEHQRTFSPSETAHFSISGYVNGRRKRHSDQCRLQIYATQLSAVLGNPDSASALLEVNRSYDPAPALPAALLKPKGGVPPRTLIDRPLPITQDDREGFFYQRVSLGRLPYGLYLAQVAHGNQTVCAWLVVTDTALIVKQAGRQIVAYTAEMQSGAPCPAAQVRAYRRGKFLAGSTGDSRGVTSFYLPTPPPEAQNSFTPDLMIVASRGSDEAIVTQGLGASEDQGAYRVSAYTDRPVYRPGQTIYFKGVVRKALPVKSVPATESLNGPAGEPAPRYSVPVGVPVHLQIHAPSGETVLDTHEATNRNGTFNGSVQLSPEAATGVYTLLTEVEDSDFTHDIVVASYKKPEFSVSVTPEETRYVHGDTVQMQIRALYYFGAPVAGASVSYNIYGSPDWSAEYEDEGLDPDEIDDPSSADAYFGRDQGESYYGNAETQGTATLDGSGKVVVSFPTRRNHGDEQTPDEIYTVDVTVTAPGNLQVEQTGQAKVAAGSFDLYVSPAGYIVAPGEPGSVRVSAKDPAGKPQPGVAVTLETGYEFYSERSTRYHKTGSVTLATGADGAVITQVSSLRPGELKMVARAQDAGGRPIVAEAYLWVMNDAGG
ncbi:MAG TPA: MG2 domain-containing protein, partial [Chthonomonadales bacterium]|nr:MG2 domain-containing protein [Chthonomonadales bacterium]